MRLTDLDKCDRKLFYKQAGGWDSLITAKAAFDMLDSLPVEELPVFKWIPVSERLPEEKQAVLVWCPQYKNIYCAYLEKEQWWIFGAFVQIVPNEVVAWMPLPKPYEPQERSEE